MNNIIPWDYRIELEMTEEEYKFLRHIRRLRAQGRHDLINKILNQIDSKG
jgi:phosphorylcholine metabolism protein LicD